MEFIPTWLRFYLGLQTSSKTENANKKQNLNLIQIEKQTFKIDRTYNNMASFLPWIANIIKEENADYNKILTWIV